MTASLVEKIAQDLKDAMKAKDDLPSSFVHVMDPHAIDLNIAGRKGKSGQIFKPLVGRSDNRHSGVPLAAVDQIRSFAILSLLS